MPNRYCMLLLLLHACETRVCSITHLFILSYARPPSSISGGAVQCRTGRWLGSANEGEQAAADSDGAAFAASWIGSPRPSCALPLGGGDQGQSLSPDLSDAAAGALPI